jgi:pyruvate dehydrogenase E1 component
MSDPHRDVTIRLRRTDGYKFEVAYADPAATRIQIDEPPPLGEGQGPNPSQVLASAVAGCLGASLLFCLGKRDAAVDSMQVEAKVTTGRNDQNRLRIQGIRVELRPGVGEDAREALEKCKRVRRTSTPSRAEQPADPGVPRQPRARARIKSIIRWNAMAMVVRANRRHRRRASAGTSRPTPQRPRSTRWASTTSSAGKDHPSGGDLDLLPGPRLARHLRPGLPGGPAHRRATDQLPPRAARRRRPVSLPPPLADARLLAVPDRVDGPRPDHGHLPRPVHQVPQDRGLKTVDNGPEGLGFLGDGEMRRAGDAGRHLAGRPRAAGQPDLRHQLQPAAPRRPGARQRQDHPGTRSRLPRGRLERHQGHLGQRLGPLFAKDNDGCSSSAWARSSTASTRSTPSRRRVHPRALLGAPTPGCGAMVKHLSDDELWKLNRGGHDPPRSTPPTRRRADHRRPTVILAAPSRATAWARRRRQEHHPPAEEAQRRGDARHFRDRFNIPIRRRGVAEGPFYRPPRTSSAEIDLPARAPPQLGGPFPQRSTKPLRSPCPADLPGVPRRHGRPRSVDHHGLRPHADQAAQGQEAGQAHRADRPRRGADVRHGSAVPPVRHLLARRPEVRTGRRRPVAVLQGATRTGRSSRKASPRPADVRFIAAGTAYSNHGVPMMPFYIYYSMFGFQRIGDLVWAAATCAPRAS